MKTVVVFGGSGFIGQRAVKFLVDAGYHVIVPTRKREKVKANLIVLPNTDIVACDPTDSRSITELVARADIIFNFVGILHETSKSNFESVHIEFVRKLTDAISQVDNVRQVIHFSALGAMTGAPSAYLRSKGKGEVYITKISRAKWTVIRSSVVFGQGDSFLGLFEKLLRYFPVLMVPAMDARFQPIWVDDLVKMSIACIQNSKCFNKALLAGGPHPLYLAEIIAALQQAMGVKRTVLKAGASFSRLMAFVLEHIPFLPPLLTRDNLDSMSVPSTCESDNDAVDLVKGKLKSLSEYLAIASRSQSTTVKNNEYRHVARRE